MSICCVGIVGTGSHCRDVAALFAEAGLRVRILPWGRADGRPGIWGVAGEVEVVQQPADLYECDLVVECVPGSIEAQREAIAALEPHLSSGAILAVTTALAPLDGFAGALRRPAQAVGIRFPRPVGATEHIEISISDDTAPGVHQSVRQICAHLGRAPVPIVADAAE